MAIKKKIIKNLFVQHFLAFLSALYIKLVRTTSVILEKNIESPEFYWKNNKPFILAFWHNQLMLISYCWKSNSKIIDVVLTSFMYKALKKAKKC